MRIRGTLALVPALSLILSGCSTLDDVSHFFAAVEDFIRGDSEAAVQIEDGHGESEDGGGGVPDDGSGVPDDGGGPLVTAASMAPPPPVTLEGTNFGSAQSGSTVNVYQNDGETLVARLAAGNPRIRHWSDAEIKFAVPGTAGRKPLISVTIDGIESNKVEVILQ